MDVYGWGTEEEAYSHVDVYQDYKDLLKRDDIDAVIIALATVFTRQGLD